MNTSIKRTRWNLIAFVLVMLAALYVGYVLNRSCPSSELRLEINEVVPTSPHPYAVIDAGLEPNAEQYTDRSYRFIRVPRRLIGASFIQTANDDKNTYQDDTTLTFEVNQCVTVYIAHDRRLEEKPAWLRNWDRTDLVLLTDDLRGGHYDVYRKQFPKGTISLGGNTPVDTHFCMYTVIVTPAHTRNFSPVVNAGSDRTLRRPTETIRLVASAVDDGQPADELSYEWNLESGPADVALSDPMSLDTTATFVETGDYQLGFTACDGDRCTTDRMTVRVRPPEPPFARAERHALLVNEGLNRSRAFLNAWLSAADHETGLIPRWIGGEHVWRIKDTAADCYPFMVLAAEITAPELYEGAVLDMLHAEQRLTSRVGALPDNFDLITKDFNAPVNMARIQFGAAEYIKDGLIAITEWLGETPWRDRMMEIMDDAWKHAPIETPDGPIVSVNVENNGEMLQILPRLYWMTGEEKYLEWAIRLGDYYLLGTNHPTRDMEEIRLRDHGCEIVSGLCELYAACFFARPDKYAEYKAPLYEMLDRILEVGRSPAGFFYDVVNPQTGDVIFGRLGDNFGYNYNGYYTVYLLDGHEPYRQAVLDVMPSLHRYPAFHGGEPMDGHCDSVEGLLYLINREPTRQLDEWVDHTMQTLWAMQRDDGFIRGMYLDGNFARTTLLYSLWKTQGATLRPWLEDLYIGASRDGAVVEIYLRADVEWRGRLHFDTPRHKEHLNLPIDWPRINQFSPEWAVIEPTKSYTIENVATGQRTTYSGEDLQQGLPMAIESGQEIRLRLIMNDAAPGSDA